MAKTLAEQIDAIARDEQRIKEAELRKNENISKIVVPIAEKISNTLRGRLEEALRADLSLAAKIDLSKDRLREKVDEFIRSFAEAAKPKDGEKLGKVKIAPVDLEPKAQGIGMDG